MFKSERMVYFAEKGDEGVAGSELARQESIV